MSTFRSRASVPIAIIIALAITPALSGCFGNPIESIIEQATGGDVDLGGNSVPDGFPSEVPLVDGEVQFGASASDGDSTVFNVAIKVTGDSPVESIQADLDDAGFTQQTGITGDPSEGGTLIYTSDDWGVLVVVAKDGDGGFLVNYTVTSANE